MLNKSSNIDIGNRIMRLRTQYGYTREVLAEKLGITWQHLANIEKGRRKVTTDLLFKLKEHLNVSTDYILFGSNEENTNDRQLIPVIQSISDPVYSIVEKTVISLINSLENFREL